MSYASSRRVEPDPTNARTSMSAPMAIPINNGFNNSVGFHTMQSQYSSYGDSQSDYCTPGSSLDTTLDDMMFSPSSYDGGLSQQYFMPSTLQPSPLTESFFDEQIFRSDEAIDMCATDNAHVYAAHWTATIPMSASVSFLGSLDIPRQSNHDYIEHVSSQTSGGNSSDVDSDYCSGPTVGGMSFASAPSTTMLSTAGDDQHEVPDKPMRSRKKLFKCDLPGGHPTRIFSSIFDLERHQTAIHGILPRHSRLDLFRCAYQGCRNHAKLFIRKDNFRDHLMRKHFQFGTAKERKEAVDACLALSRVELTTAEILQEHARKQTARAQATRKRSTKRTTRQSTTRDTSALYMEDISSADPSTLDESEWLPDGFDEDLPLYETSDLGDTHQRQPAPTSQPRSCPLPVTASAIEQHTNTFIPASPESDYDLW